MKALLPICLLVLLAGCDDRLDGRDQPNPFAEKDGTIATVQAPPGGAMDSAPAMAERENVEEPDGGFGPAGADDGEAEFDDGPFDPSGFDAAPMDDASGIDPEPIDPDGGGFAD